MRHTRPHLGMLAAMAMAPLAEMKIIVRDEEPAEPPAPRQARTAAPAYGRIYKPNGAREMARRRRQMARSKT